MGGLNGLDGKLRTGVDYRPAGIIGENGVPARSAAEGAAQEGVRETAIPVFYRKDEVIWSEEQEMEDLDTSAQAFIERLKGYYPDIQFHITDGDEAADLAQAAADFGKGMHLVISSGFLERMSSSRDEFDKCSRILANEAVKLLKSAGNSAGSGVFLEKDRAVSWSASAKDKEPVLPVVSSTKQESSGTGTGGIKYSYNAPIQVSGHYKKLASARTSGQVQQVMGDIQYSMMKLKLAAIYSEDEDRVKASRAVRSLQKLLSRGNRKIRRLNREKLKQCAQKKAQQQMEERKQRELELELKKMRSASKRADYALVQEGMADEAHIRGYRRYKGLQDPFTQRALEPGEMVMLQTVAGMDMGAAGMDGGSFAAGDITFSGEISF